MTRDGAGNDGNLNMCSSHKAAKCIKYWYSLFYGPLYDDDKTVGSVAHFAHFAHFPLLPTLGRCKTMPRLFVIASRGLFNELENRTRINDDRDHAFATVWGVAHIWLWLRLRLPIVIAEAIKFIKYTKGLRPTGGATPLRDGPYKSGRALNCQKRAAPVSISSGPDSY